MGEDGEDGGGDTEEHRGREKEKRRRMEEKWRRRGSPSFSIFLPLLVVIVRFQSPRCVSCRGWLSSCRVGQTCFRVVVTTPPSFETLPTFGQFHAENASQGAALCSAGPWRHTPLLLQLGLPSDQKPRCFLGLVRRLYVGCILFIAV